MTQNVDAAPGRITVHCRQCDGEGVIYDEDSPRLPTEIKCAGCEGTGRQSHTVYANVYAVTRHYGGPEEGGWWYDVGLPLGSIRIDPDARQRDEVIDELRKLYADEQCPRGRSSVIGGADVVVEFEDRFAEAWPTERPRYE